MFISKVGHIQYLFIPTCSIFSFSLSNSHRGKTPKPTYNIQFHQSSVTKTTTTTKTTVDTSRLPNIKFQTQKHPLMSGQRRIISSSAQMCCLTFVPVIWKVTERCVVRDRREREREEDRGDKRGGWASPADGCQSASLYTSHSITPRTRRPGQDFLRQRERGSGSVLPHTPWGGR